MKNKLERVEKFKKRKKFIRSDEKDLTTKKINESG